MSEKMVRTQVYLPRDIYEQLKQRANEEGITMAHQIREALLQYVADRPEGNDAPVLSPDDPVWNLIGMCKGGPEDGSVNHDKYIYGRDWEREEGNR